MAHVLSLQSSDDSSTLVSVTSFPGEESRMTTEELITALFPDSCGGQLCFFFGLLRTCNQREYLLTHGLKITDRSSVAERYHSFTQTVSV